MVKHTASSSKTKERGQKVSLLSTMSKYKWLYLLLLPGVLYFIVFRYAPMYGLIIAFKNYVPNLGINGSPWVGFTNFRNFFVNPDFFRLFKNTLVLALLNIGIGFPFPIILALMLNELRQKIYSKLVQTFIYIPHFISWAVTVSLTFILLSVDSGVITDMMEAVTGNRVDLLTSVPAFRPLIVFQSIWKESGYGTVIYLAALAGVDQNQYEAAIMDGAGRFSRLWHVTLPAIRSTIVVMLILRVGSFLTTGFDQIYLMTNSLNRTVADVFDTYVYTVGITQGSYSYSTAVGLFKSLIGIILVTATNKIAKKLGESGLY
ncbi:ABC transporter permease [Streptococcus merionis]|uniref:Protein LplB n=1 Tax=Streptococcus merionis TaxID=400065 RepID=A0A239SMN0_9STRE|nr:ABC transporter permease subunit [Streptococcus merionis]SNU86549.1 protein LplB [Streptococcus merionis]